ncbi:DUF2894 domain-containing protein [Novilysobacter antarcticus]|uniref:DUF2894 domain-containing protein n=1 Tax=Novilysobacter antarcticus TaxID=2862543 RepID=UPI001C99B566|nr:DUF2894 domain-containing protein [Lysobacter antarcticus]
MQADAASSGATPAPRPAKRLQRTNRVRDALISVMQRQLGETEGEIARLLQARIAELRQSGFAGADAPPATHSDPPANPARSQRLVLGLSEYIEASKQAGHPATSTEAEAIAGCRLGSPSAVLGEFRTLWDRIRTDTQLRAALTPIPDDAGPLHSSALLHRALRLMGDTSPGYLQHFIAYADALSWMEQLQQAGLLEAASRNAVASPSGKTRARKRTGPKQSPVKSPTGRAPSDG